MIEFKTKEVAQLLNVSEPSVRNYAKLLEKYGHEFHKRRQARIWTDVEISRVREILNLFEQGGYELETCFQYVIAKENVGEERASELLANPIEFNSDSAIPQIYQMESNIMKAIEDLKGEVSASNNLKIDYRENNEKYENEIELLKEEVNNLKKELESSTNKQRELQEKYTALNDELDTVINLNVFGFLKYKKNKIESKINSNIYNK